MMQQRRGRSALGATLGFLLLTILAACNAGDRDTPAPTPDQVVAAVPNASDIGGADPPTCNFGSSGACIGYTNLAFEDPANSAELVKFLDAVDTKGNWSKSGPETDRTTLPNGKDAKFALRVIIDAQSVRFKDLRDGAVVMARIDVTGGSKKDQRYGIGPDEVREMGKRFYLVVDGFQPRSEVNGSTAFGVWRIYGITTRTRELRQVGNVSGRFRWCANVHTGPQRADGARFNTCASAHALHSALSDLAAAMPAFSAQLAASDSGRPETLLAALERVKPKGKSLNALTAPELEAALRDIAKSTLSAAEFSAALPKSAIDRILKILEDSPNDPAWMTCGIGCCIADT